MMRRVLMKAGGKLTATAGVLALLAVALGLAWPFWSGVRSRVDVLVLPGVVEVQEVRLGSKVGGRVKHVRTYPGLPAPGMPVEGAVVEPGTVLVTFEEPELEAQLSQWKARLDAEEAMLQKLRNGSRPEEIDASRAAEAAAEARFIRSMVGFREEEVRQARNDSQSADADLKLAEEELGRAEKLWVRQSIPRSEHDTAIANYNRARGRALAARARLDMLTAGSRAEDIAEASALLDQAKANLRLLRAGFRAEEIANQAAKVDETRHRVEELQANLAEAQVRSPSRAVVDVVSVRPGDLVPAGQVVARILLADDLWVKVFVPETLLGKVTLNQPAEVTVDAYPGRKFAGTVVYIAPQSEFTPRNIQSVDERRHQVFAAKVRVADPQGVFKSGMAAEVSLRLGAPKPAGTR